jgi:hypothetical protein
MENKYINALVNFIKENDDWETKLKKNPFNLKTIKWCTWQPNWCMFVYNLFNSELTNDIVRGCRGTVLEIDGKNIKVISAPYTKFFGYGDPSGKDIEESINWKNAQIQEKVDGILVKTASVYWELGNGEIEKRLYFFTNGSFDLNAPFEDSLVYDEPETRGADTYGDLLKYALSKVIKDKIEYSKEYGFFYCTGDFANDVPVGATLMLELTSPRNRIICDYKETKIWLHGYRNSMGIEMNPRMIKGLEIFDMPKLYDAHNYEELKEILKTFKGNEQEGVVVVDYSTEGTPRAKIKCDDYLKLKFARDSACNTHVLFKAVVENEYDDLIANIPATLPKINEIIENIKKVEDWITSESLRVRFDNFNNVRDYVTWVKENTKPSLFSYYMDMKSPMVLLKFEKKLHTLAVKKHGYEELLKLLEEINA